MTSFADAVMGFLLFWMEAVVVTCGSPRKWLWWLNPPFWVPVLAIDREALQGRGSFPEYGVNLGRDCRREPDRSAVHKHEHSLLRDRCDRKNQGLMVGRMRSQSRQCHGDEMRLTS